MKDSKAKDLKVEGVEDLVLRASDVRVVKDLRDVKTRDVKVEALTVEALKAAA